MISNRESGEGGGEAAGESGGDASDADELAARPAKGASDAGELPVRQAEGAPDAGELSARAVWDEIERGEILGLTHALGNSAHALELLMVWLVPGVDVTADIVSAFREDVDRFAELVEMLRLIPFAAEETASAGTVTDAVAQAVRLFGHHASAREAVCDVTTHEAPAIFAPPTALIQAVLMLLAVAIPEAGGAPRVEIIVGGDADAATVEFRYLTSRGGLDRAAVACSWMLRSCGARLRPQQAGELPSIVLSLPSLAAVRRR